jgi:hypothetical protein
VEGEDKEWINLIIPNVILALSKAMFLDVGIVNIKLKSGNTRMWDQ